MQRFSYISFLFAIIACSQQGKESMTTNAPELYTEKHRLQLHFSPVEKWMNDPNGMIYFEGEYHLFYQYYPDSTVWGPMHWGHAVSRDMIHWEHLPIALYPDSLGYIFSGSAVFDKNNTSGLGTNENPPLVAIFTYHDADMEKKGSELFQTQGIAYSVDKGRTWTKYSGNPVLPNPGIRDFRDPKVLWLESQQKWLMALAVKDHISFYSSADLKDWSLESDFGSTLGAHGGVWECPDLFQLGDKWVLLVSINPGGPNGGSATQYFVGDFDGKTFTPQDTVIRWLDFGRDNYAGVTWSNIPPEDGRRLFIGWMSNWDYGTMVPTDRWRSAMTLPRELALLKSNNGYIISSHLVKEVEQLRTDSVIIQTANDVTTNVNPRGFTTYDLTLSVSSATSSAFELVLSNDVGEMVQMGYNPSEQLFYINRDKAGRNNFSEKFNGLQTAPFVPASSTMNLRVIVDHGSVEVFVDDTLAMTALYFSSELLTNAILTSAFPISVNGTNYQLKSIW